MVELSQIKKGQRVRVTFEAEVETINPNVPGDQVIMLHHEHGYNWVSPGQIEKILPAPIKVGDKVRLNKQFELFYPYVVREVLGIHGKSAWVTSNGEWFPDGTLVPLDLLVRC